MLALGYQVVKVLSLRHPPPPVTHIFKTKPHEALGSIPRIPEYRSWRQGI